MKLLSLFRPRSYRKVVSDARAYWSARRDRSQIAALFPGLDEAVQGACRAELADAYHEYVRDVSIPRMALSLPLAACLLWLGRERRPARVADLGSGFSSFVLRHYQATADLRPEVWSVDDHAGWLERTRAYLGARGVSTDNLMTWEEFLVRRAAPFDLVLHDLGSIELRGATVAQVFQLVAPGGLLVLDDFHRFDYRARVAAARRGQPLLLLNLREHLRDEFGRYPAFVLPAPGRSR